jgi:hypothetical protein
MRAILAAGSDLIPRQACDARRSRHLDVAASPRFPLRSPRTCSAHALAWYFLPVGGVPSKNGPLLHRCRKPHVAPRGPRVNAPRSHPSAYPQLIHKGRAHAEWPTCRSSARLAWQFDAWDASPPIELLRVALESLLAGGARVYSVIPPCRMRRLQHRLRSPVSCAKRATAPNSFPPELGALAFLAFPDRALLGLGQWQKARRVLRVERGVRPIGGAASSPATARASPRIVGKMSAVEPLPNGGRPRCCA